MKYDFLHLEAWDLGCRALASDSCPKNCAIMAGFNQDFRISWWRHRKSGDHAGAERKPLVQTNKSKNPDEQNQAINHSRSL
jgi:hypothetical protein